MKMSKLDFIQVSLEEVISYTKQKDVPAVTIIADVTGEDFKYIGIIASRLKLYVILVKNTNMVAIIDNTLIARKIAKELNKRCQIMYYDFIQKPSGSITIYALTGYTHHFKILRDNGHIVKAFDEHGNEIRPWINTTDLENVAPINLNALKFNKYNCSVSLNGRLSNTLLEEHSRQNYLNDGIYINEHNCYYPSGRSTKEIAEINKLNKLFNKLGIKRL